MTGTKYPWQSKTVLINSVLALLGVVAMFVPAAAPIAAWINANGVLIASLWGVLNVILRFLTKDAIVLGD